jgi:hypothetical protein
MLETSSIKQKLLHKPRVVRICSSCPANKLTDAHTLAKIKKDFDTNIPTILSQIWHGFTM